MDALASSAFTIGAIICSLIGGALVVLIPLLFGMKKGQKTLAIVGFVCCVVGSFVLGMFLSFPVAIVFALIIYFKAKSKK
jgi:hypothetical protein